MRGDKEFQHIKTFFEVAFDRELDDITRRRNDETLHAHDLAELTISTAGAGIDHGVNRTVLVENIFVVYNNTIFNIGPNFENARVALAVSQEAFGKLLFHFLDLRVAFFDQFRFFFDSREVIHTERVAGLGDIAIT